jgi:hypothetical protein
MTGPAVTAPDTTQQAVKDLLDRIFNSSNWRGEVEKTAKTNVKLLEKKRQLQAIVDKIGAKFNLETGEPKEGKLLTKDEAAAYDAFTGLKLKPEELKALVEEHGKLKAKEVAAAEEQQFADAAEALEFENVPALTRWLVREGLVLEFKDQRVEDEETGKKVLKRMPYVRPKADEKAALEPLEDYIEREVPEFVDTFRTAPQSDDDEEVGDGDRGGDELDADELVRRASAEAEDRVGGKGRRDRKGGVRIPATRSARGDSAGSRDKKTLEKLEQGAREDPLYAM